MIAVLLKPEAELLESLGVDSQRRGLHSRYHLALVTDAADQLGSLPGQVRSDQVRSGQIRLGQVRLSQAGPDRSKQVEL